MSTPTPCPDPAQEARLRAQLALGLDLSAGPAPIPPAQTEAYLALVDYYTLWGQCQQAASAVDIATGTQRQALGQQFSHLLSLLTVAEGRIAAYGYGPKATSMGTLILDFLEPQGSAPLPTT
jgi:hypothetical protein